MLKRIGAVLLALVAAAAITSDAAAQSGDPIKIGFGMALTGPLAANGKQALLGMKIWEEETNAKGGLLGRPVKLVNYDDQSNPSTVPGIYTKLLDVDKVDLVVSPYATNMIAPAMPVVMQKGKTFITLFGLDVNHEFQHPKYFAMIPTGPDPKASFTDGFFQVAAAQNPKPQTAALVAADAEFSNNACEGARQNAKKYAFKIVYDKTYPPSTTDFTPVVRAVQAANPDIVVVCSYPLNSVGMLKAVNEVGYKPKMIGGAMVGLQATAFKNQLGPLLNGVVNYETWVPDEKMLFAGTDDFFKKYQARAAAEGVDPLGYYLADGATPTCKFWAMPCRRQKASTTTSSPNTSARPRSRRSWAMSRSAKAVNGTRAACCRCSITASSRAPGSRRGVAWTIKQSSRRATTRPVT